MLKIITYPAPILRQIAEGVTTVDDEVRGILDEMTKCMYASGGVGLAAPQVGISRRLVVIDPAEEEEDMGKTVLKLVNPRIVSSSGKLVWSEGCLSLPGINADVERNDRVTAEALNENGESITIEGEGLLAVALQHELDHLDGVLFVDRLSRLKKKLVMRNYLRQAGKHTEE